MTTDAAGNASFTATVSGVPSGYNYFAATATDSVGNSSEFSYDPTPGNPPRGRTVALPPPPTLTPIVGKAQDAKQDSLSILLSELD